MQFTFHNFNLNFPYGDSGQPLHCTPRFAGTIFTPWSSEPMIYRDTAQNFHHRDPTPALSLVSGWGNYSATGASHFRNSFMKLTIFCRYHQRRDILMELMPGTFT